VAKLADALP